MRKNIMKIGTMALAASMMLTPVSSVFAADGSQETAVFETDGTRDAFTDIADTADSGFADSNAGVENGNSAEILSDADSESDAEPMGLITTPYTVTASSLNVRSGRGTNYSIIGSLTKGQTVYVYNGSLSKGWVKIKFSGSTGYVSAQYLEKK